MFAQRLYTIPRRLPAQFGGIRSTTHRNFATKTPSLIYSGSASCTRRNRVHHNDQQTLFPIASFGRSGYRALHVTSLLQNDINSGETMLAFRYFPGETTAVRETVPIPTPKSDEVIIKVLAGGVCHSDLGILDPSGAIGEWQNPFTLGHEGAGIISALGSDISKTHPKLKEGTYVAVLGPDPCFEASCTACSEGKDNLCTTTDQWYGIGRDGAWASYIAVRASCALPVPGTPETIPPAVVAVATDAVLTPYHALKTCVALQPSQTIVVLGCGGLGQNAIQISKNVLKAKNVIACDMRESSLERAQSIGADFAVTPDDLSDFLKSHKLSPDVVIDFVGTQTSFETALANVRPSGIIHIVGLMQPSIQLRLMQAVLKDLTIKMSFWGTKSELIEVLQAVADGKVAPLVETKPLEDCLQVLKDFHEGKFKSRVALIP